MDNKFIKFCTHLSVIDSNGVIVSKPPNFENISISTKLNLTTNTINEFGIICLPGECVIYKESDKGIYFDINKEGELTVISPDNYSFLINDSGELLMIY